MWFRDFIPFMLLVSSNPRIISSDTEKNGTKVCVAIKLEKMWETPPRGDKNIFVSSANNTRVMKVGESSSAVVRIVRHIGRLWSFAPTKRLAWEIKKKGTTAGKRKKSRGQIGLPDNIIFARLTDEKSAFARQSVRPFLLHYVIWMWNGVYINT